VVMALSGGMTGGRGQQRAGAMCRVIPIAINVASVSASHDRHWVGRNNVGQGQTRADRG